MNPKTDPTNSPSATPVMFCRANTRWTSSPSPAIPKAAEAPFPAWHTSATTCPLGSNPAFPASSNAVKKRQRTTADTTLPGTDNRQTEKKSTGARWAASAWQ